MSIFYQEKLRALNSTDASKKRGALESAFAKVVNPNRVGPRFKTVREELDELTAIAEREAMMDELFGLLVNRVIETTPVDPESFADPDGGGWGL